MDRRPKRQCVSRKVALPSAAHYVGYVEDQETPEMIMRKFEELEKVMAAANKQKRSTGASSSRAAGSGADSEKENLTGLNPSSTTSKASQHRQHGGQLATALDNTIQFPASMSSPNLSNSSPPTATVDVSEEPLDESLLVQVFKQTSIFNVRSALANNAVLLHLPGASKEEGKASASYQLLIEEETELLSGDEDNQPSEDGGDLEYLRGFWSDEEMFEQGKGKAKASKKQGARSRRPRDKEPSMWKVLGVAARERNIRHQIVMQYNKDTHALIRRKMRVQNIKNAIIQVRVPGPPLPTAWGRTVRPYDPTAVPIHLTIPCAPIRLCPPPPPPAFPEDITSPTSRLLLLNLTSGLLEPGTSLPSPLQRHMLTMDAADDAGTPTGSIQRHPWLSQAEGISGGSQVPIPPGMGPTRSQSLDLMLCSQGLEVQQPSARCGKDSSSSGSWVQTAGSQQVVQQDAQQQQELSIVSYFEVPDLAACDVIKQLGGRRLFTVVLINNGWEVPDVEDDNKIVSRLRKLPVPSLCPGGFIFIWSQKIHIQATCKQLYAWGYTYVENLTWVWMHAGNTILRQPDKYCCRSHLTLIMFRKEGEGRDIQLKHQRNPDVILDCLRDPQATQSPPPELYHIIETMLPEEVAAGRCLELWAPQGVRRQGWVHAVQAKAPAH